MYENKKVLSVAALSAYADEQCNIEFEGSRGKGKGKATVNNVDQEVEIRDENKFRGEPIQSITESSGSKGTAQDFGYPAQPLIHHTYSKLQAGHMKRLPRNFSRPQLPQIIDINPFTGLPIVQETGFEAGPSNRPPPPIRKPQSSSESEWDVPIFLSASQTGPSPLPRASSHLSSKKLPRPPSKSQAQAPWSEEASRSSNPSAFSPTEPAYSINRMNSVLRKPLPSNPQSAAPHLQRLSPSAEITNYGSLMRSFPSNSRTFNNFDGSNEIDQTDESNFNPRRSKYFRHITDLASKALKAAGTIIKAARTATISQSKELPPRTPSPGYSPPRYRLSEDDALIILHDPAAGTLRRLKSQDTLPPAYDTLPPINRRSSLGSTSSDAASSIFTASPGQPNTLSPASTEPSFSPEFTQQGDQILLNATSSQPIEARKGWAWRSSTTVDESPERIDINRTFTSHRKKNRRKTPSGSKITNSKSVRPKYSIHKSQPIKWDTVQRETDSFRDPLVDTSQSIGGTIPKASPQEINPLEWYQKLPGSNNPWKSHMTGDEALAKALQEEEHREAQLERDILLAHALANGTAEESDLELAYFMSKQTEKLLASTYPSSGEISSPSPFITTNNYSTTTLHDEQSRLYLHPDMLRAQEIQQQLIDEDAALNASLAAALKLQAEFDQDAEAEEAWEAWKKINIEECIVCGDEQHREELLRPCKHAYCEGCLQEGFRTALKSQTPFKCCNDNLNIDDCIGLEANFVTEYQEMMLEFTTSNPMYCSNRRCGKFLPSRAFIADVGTCTRCRAQTCKHCRQRHHAGTFCPEDTETAKVKELAKAKGWKTCPGCNHLIERKDGCLHMVCSRCQTAFCYRCSKKWKDCESTCPDPISATHPKI